MAADATASSAALVRRSARNRLGVKDTDQAACHQSVSHYRTHTTEHTVPLHTLIFCTSVRWNLCIFEVFFWQGSHFRLILHRQGLPFVLQVDLLLQVGLPFTLQVDSCFRIVVPSLFTYLPSAQILMRTDLR